ncbi:MAG TPA: hypothetical protein VMT32_17485 [Bryobacteraceae bacterium]|nr:hypothetical protein [Bryobacteraceae bacterium]
MDPQDHWTGNDEERLDALFAAYRSACPDPEPTSGFMPQLWQKIEARERSSTIFSHLVRNLVTAALALSGIMALAVSVSHSHASTLPPESYVEVLAEDHASQDLGYFEPVQVEPAADQR